MPSCKRHVYKTMCETDKGKRTGKYGKVRYESAWKGGRTSKPASKTPSTSKRTPKGKRTPKATRTPAKREIGWETFKKVKIKDESMPYENDGLDEMEMAFEYVEPTKANRGRMSPEQRNIQLMYLKDAFMRRQIARRKRKVRA